MQESQDAPVSLVISGITELTGIHAFLPQYLKKNIYVSSTWLVSPNSLAKLVVKQFVLPTVVCESPYFYISRQTLGIVTFNFFLPLMFVKWHLIALISISLIMQWNFLFFMLLLAIHRFSSETCPLISFTYFLSFFLFDLQWFWIWILYLLNVLPMSSSRLLLIFQLIYGDFLLIRTIIFWNS